MENLERITKTKEGHEVKNLRFKTLDNIIVGLVKDPIFGKENLHEGFVSCQWTKYGKPIRNNKGREEFILELS
jgi:hypothetical protein